jgi:hypothetical protein
LGSTGETFMENIIRSNHEREGEEKTTKKRHRERKEKYFLWLHGENFEEKAL